MNVLKSSITTVLLSVFVCSAAVHAKPQAQLHIQQIQSDIHYSQKRAEVSETLKKRGFEVRKISADSYQGQAVLAVEAFKNGQKYAIKIAYPSLKVLVEKRDDGR